MRWKLTIEYDGGPFAGWQRQEGLPSVQAAVEAAIFAFTAESVLVYGAGRTDSGVHALGQVAHVDIEKPLTQDKIRDAINALIRPLPVSIIKAEPVPLAFHARYSAIRRDYRYRILNRRPPPALERDRVWHVPAELSAGAMHAAAQHLIGTHDFNTFRSAACQAKSSVKTLDMLNVTQSAEEIWIDAAARSFLHNQVRSLAGSLKLVGEGKWSQADLVDALRARDRAACGPVAPPGGLYLMRVDYPPAGKSIS